MARDRRSERQSRRDREAAADRQQRLIVIGSGAVLAIVAVVVIAGLFWTRYLPPRAHILTVEDRSYDAAAIVDRGKFLVTFEGQNDSLANVASATIDVLIFEETLRRRGPLLVGEVTQDQIDAELQNMLGFDPLAETPTPTPTATSTPTATASPTPTAIPDDASGDGGDEPEPEATPTPRDELFPLPADAPRELSESEREAYLDALASTLKSSGLSKADLEAIAEARVVRRLLNRYFDEQLGPTGEQLRLSRLTVDSPARAEELRQRALAGEPFEDLVLEADEDAAVAGGEDSTPGDLGWFPRDLIPDNIADALEGIDVGGVSEVVDRGVSFEVYYIAELEPDRIWEDAARQLLARDAVREWEEAEVEQMTVEIDLSSGEETWIIERVVSHVSGQVRAPASGGS